MTSFFKLLGFIIGVFMLTNLANMMIVGLNVPLYSSKYWALFIFVALILLTFLEWWKHVEIKKE